MVTVVLENAILLLKCMILEEQGRHHAQEYLCEKLATPNTYFLALYQVRREARRAT